MRVSFPEGIQKVKLDYRVKDKRYKDGLRPWQTVEVTLEELEMFMRRSNVERGKVTLPTLVSRQLAAARPCTDSTSS